MINISKISSDGVKSSRKQTSILSFVVKSFERRTSFFRKFSFIQETYEALLGSTFKIGLPLKSEQ